MIRITQAGLLNISYFFLVLFLFSSGISISASQISLAIGLLFFLFAVIKNKKAFDLTGLERYILPFIIISIILSFLSPQILKNLFYIRDFWLLFAFILCYYLHNSRKNVLKTFYLIAAVVLIQSLIALIQMSFNFSFINEANEIGFFRYNSPDDSLRIRGGLLGMHLVFSCYLMLIAVPVIYVAAACFKTIKGNVKWILIFIAILSISVLFITRSRSIMTAVPFVLIPVVLAYKKWRIITVLFLLIMSILAGAFLIYRGQDQLSSQVKGNILDSLSTEQRIKIWKTAFHVWLKHPIIGSGGGNYLDVYKQVLKEHPEYDSGMVTHAHNDYLNQLARKGIIGFLAFIYMLFGIFKYMVVNLKNINDKFMKALYLGLFAAYCVFLVASLFQCFYTDDEDLVMFWFAIGLLAAIVKIEKRKKYDNTVS
ncbi:MAG: O-antigen ligase family protein [Spirochaetes bacterium]|nr:O-antigen ligase family protein [Spirochaetota bacterium]